jgi:hemerythrin-like domain-containing protein
MDIPKLLDALVRRHRELTLEAHALTRALAAVSAPERLVGVFQAFVDAMRFHVQREEQFLFPAIRAMVAGEDEGIVSLRGTMSTIELEHEELLELEAPLRALAKGQGDLGERILRFLDAWETHHDREDLQLFGAVRDRLDGRSPPRGVRVGA